MYSGAVRKLIKSMTPDQRQKLAEDIELGKTVALMESRLQRINQRMLEFIQAELKYLAGGGERPKLIEKRRTYRRNSKCRIIRKGGKVTQ